MDETRAPVPDPGTRKMKAGYFWAQIDDLLPFAWLGIPDAAPPVDDLRWMPPQAPEPWPQALVVDSPPQACAQEPQLGSFATPGDGEDCLYLNGYGDRQAINRARAAGEGT